MAIQGVVDSQRAGLVTLGLCAVLGLLLGGLMASGHSGRAAGQLVLATNALLLPLSYLGTRGKPWYLTTLSAALVLPLAALGLAYAFLPEQMANVVVGTVGGIVAFVVLVRGLFE